MLLMLKCGPRLTGMQTGEPDADGYTDEYPLDELEFTIADYMQRGAIPNFQDAWAAAQDEQESVSTFSWSTVNTLQGMDWLYTESIVHDINTCL